MMPGPEAIGALGLVALVVLIVARLPVGVALGLVGAVGYAAIEGWPKALVALGATPLDLGRNYSLTVLPLFILMGTVAAKTKMARELFDAINTLLSGVRGSLAIASVMTCAGFGAISGSSLATAATISRIAVPEMQRHGYEIKIATATVASAGTLGILIPPSIIMIVYAIIAEESVPALFAAGMIPGLLLALFHVLLLMGMGLMFPAMLPVQPSRAVMDRILAISGLWKLAMLFGLAVGGIYLGWFSPTEAAAVGALAAILIAALTGQLTRSIVIESLVESVRTSASLFVIIMGGFMFGYFMVFSGIPAALGKWIEAAGFSPIAVIALIVLIYIVFGLFLDSISMMLITVPVFLPIVKDLGFDPVWFGIFVVLVAEIGLITPPVGMNIFVIKSQLPDIRIQDMYAGIMPFLLIDLLLIALLVAFPGLALWLPRLLL